MITKLIPSCKDYLWGGQRLKTDYNKKYDGDILAETWELSCHNDGLSIMDTGRYKGSALRDWLNFNPHGLGLNSERFDTFPILTKFIDAKQSLSIQVHPNDEYSRKYENDNGKNEMWYIVEAEPDAFIYYGFSKEVTKEEYKEHIENNTLLDVLNKVNVQAGDCFYIEAGTVHAIGAGCLIAEVQQSSNVTYRVYDFGRVGADGKLRELHVDKAIDVSTLTPSINKANKTGKLVECKYFCVEELCVNGDLTLETTDKTFNSILVLSGNGTVKGDGEFTTLGKGDSVFISADSGKYTLNGNFHALLTYIDSI